MDVEADGERLRNSRHGYGWQSWCGTIVADRPLLSCESVAILIRDDLNRAMNASCRDELTARQEPPVTKPLTGLLRYNKDGMHGDVHVWLIPDPEDVTVDYTIFVREEPLE